jgi:DNA-binding transcriptional LysR family regulator
VHPALGLDRHVAAGGARVGFYGSVSSGPLTDVPRSFTRAQPAVEVIVRELELSDIGELLDGNVDVAFTRMRPDEADAQIDVLLEEPRVDVLPAGHHLADRESVALAELRDDGFITQPRRGARRTPEGSPPAPRSASAAR